MITRDDLLRALPMRGVRATFGPSRDRAVSVLVDFEPAAEFTTPDDPPGEVDYFFDGLKGELSDHFGRELPAMAVVVRERSADPAGPNQMFDYYAAKLVVREALRRLATPPPPPFAVADLLRALPMRGVRAHCGTKSGPVGGATALIDLEPADEFEVVYAVPSEVTSKWDSDYLLPMCFDNIVIGIDDELRAQLGRQLPAVRVMVYEVLPHPVEANEMNNFHAGKKVVRAALRRLELLG